jgi:hypothetical protein
MINITVVDETNPQTLPTGEVDIENGSSTIGSGQLQPQTDARGTHAVASITVMLQPGTYSLSAHYVGSSSFQPTDQTFSEPYTVNAPTPTPDRTFISTFGVNPTHPTAGQPITFTATVSDGTQSSVIPTGEFDIIDNNTMMKLGSGNLDASGNVTITVRLSAGSYPVLFVYQGSSSFQTSNTGIPLTLTVTPGSPTPTPTHTPTPTPPPTSSQPQPAGTPTRQQSKKGTSINLSFNEPLDPSSAGNTALYNAFGAVKKKGKTVFTKRIPIKSVTVSGTNLSVLINLAKKVTGSLQLTILPGLKAANGMTSSQSTSIMVH